MGGGASEVLPQQKGCGESFSRAEWGRATKCFEVVLTQEPEVLVILKGVANSFHPLKRGGVKSYPVLRGAQKSFWPAITIIL